MKKVSKTLAIVLCLALILSLTAFAAWTTYQGDIAHNGRITDAAPHITSNPAVTQHTLTYSGTGWSGVDSEPLMKEGSDGETYAYVLYNGRSSGGRIAKVACSGANAGTEIWNQQVTTTAANQLSTPLLIGNSLYYVYNTENTQARQNFSGSFTSSQSVSITTTLTAGGSYRLYVPSRMTAAGTTTLSVKVTKPDNTSVYLNVDNDDPTETGSSTSRTLTTSTSTSYLNKNYADVFAAAGSYTITFEYTYTSGTFQIGYIYLYRNNITLEKINNVEDATPSISTVAQNLPGSGQMNTPVTTDGKYIYFGTWMSGSAHGKYFQVKISDGSVKSFMPSNSVGFYWAGAKPVDVDGDNTFDYVVFGGDGGYLYYRSISDFENAGGEYNLSTLGSVTAGNVRSSICLDGDYLYFTSQGGTNTSYIWKIPFASIASLTSSNVAKIQLSGGSSTSTPAISGNGYIYVGTYGSSTYANNGVRAIPVSNFTASAVVNVASGTGSGTTGTNLPVQCSVIVYSVPDDTTDYVFFTTNISGGKGYCYSFDTDDHSTGEVWTTANGNFTLQGMAACNGYLTFGNDANTFYIIAP